MERHHRAPLGTFFAAPWSSAASEIELGEAAAHHARVKRFSAGDLVRLTDGAGHLATAEIVRHDKRGLVVAVQETLNIPAPADIHLRVAIADRDRMLWLAEKATELGVATWQGVHFRRSASVNPRGEGPAFAPKLRLRMISALEQSGGAWLPRILDDAALDAAAAEGAANKYVLDRDGVTVAELNVRDAHAPVILVGPEGGIERDEMQLLTSNGWTRVCLAPATLRFETAAIAAVAVFRALETRSSS